MGCRMLDTSGHRVNQKRARRLDWAGRWAAPMWAAVAGAVVAGSAAGQCRYEVTLLPQLPGPFGPYGGEPRALNNAGQATGYYVTSIFNDIEKPFLWSAESGLQFIEPPAGATRTRGVDLTTPSRQNPMTAVAGDIELDDGTSNAGPRAFLWDGAYHILPVPRWANGGFANSMSEQAVIGGYVLNVNTGPLEAAFWEDGNVQIIPTPWGPNAAVEGISPDGRHMVGWMGNNPSINAHAFHVMDGNFVDLGTAPDALTGVAWAVNNKGQMVISGQYTPNLPSGFLGKLFLWEDGEFTELVNFPGFTHIFGRDINERSEVVGDSIIIEGGAQVAQRPWIWRGGSLIDFNALLIPGSGINPEAVGDLRAINDQGQILAQAGLGSSPHVSSTIVLLTPIPDRLGDTNCDGAVDVDDLLAVINAWGPCPGQFCAADLDRNLIMNQHDLLTVIEQWDLDPPSPR